MTQPTRALIPETSNLLLRIEEALWMTSETSSRLQIKLMAKNGQDGQESTQTIDEKCDCGIGGSLKLITY